MISHRLLVLPEATPLRAARMSSVVLSWALAALAGAEADGLAEAVLEAPEEAAPIEAAVLGLGAEPAEAGVDGGAAAPPQAARMAGAASASVVRKWRLVKVC